MKRITPSIVISLIALFVAATGTSIAASGLISGTQIKAHTIAASKLTSAAVTSLRGYRGAPGLDGAQGAPGSQGPQGPAGPAGGFDPSKVQQVTTGDLPVSPGVLGEATATCPAGTVVVGGGGFTSGPALWDSRPSGNGWFVGSQPYSDTETQVAAFAICAG